MHHCRGNEAGQTGNLSDIPFLLELLSDIYIQLLLLAANFVAAGREGCDNPLADLWGAVFVSLRNGIIARACILRMAAGCSLGLLAGLMRRTAYMSLRFAAAVFARGHSLLLDELILEVPIHS